MSHLAEVCLSVCSLFSVSVVGITVVFITENITGGSSTTYCVNAVLKSPVKKKEFYDQCFKSQSQSWEQE